MIARDAEEARYFAERAIAQGATAIKIYFRLPLGSAKAVIDVCRARGVVSTAHLERLDAGVLFEYGLDGVEHITSLGPSLLPQARARASIGRRCSPTTPRAPRAAMPCSPASISTAPRRTRALGRDRPAAPLHRPDARGVRAAPRRLGRQGEAGGRGDAGGGVPEDAEATRRAFEAGARIVVGGHTSVPFAARGEAPWREIELLVEAGLTPMQAIQAATANGAAFLGRARDLGTIEPGKLADLVVLTGDPLARIADIRTVERVLAGGAWVDVKRYRGEK